MGNKGTTWLSWARVKGPICETSFAKSSIFSTFWIKYDPILTSPSTQIERKPKSISFWQLIESCVERHAFCTCTAAATFWREGVEGKVGQDKRNEWRESEGEFDWFLYSAHHKQIVAFLLQGVREMLVLGFYMFILTYLANIFCRVLYSQISSRPTCCRYSIQVSTRARACWNEWFISMEGFLLKWVINFLKLAQCWLTRMKS